jgi:hypothetical protein
MKRLFTFLLLTAGLGSSAQDINWFPIGAEWYFTPQCFIEPQCGVIRYHAEIDTVIAGKTAVKIGQDITLWGPVVALWEYGIPYLRHENDTVFRYSFEADRWHFLYCVNPLPGDVWEIQTDEFLGFGEPGYTFVVEVDSVIVQDINGADRRVVYTSPVDETDVLFRRPLIEGIGSTEAAGLIASPTVMLPAGFGPNFNCYLESGNLIYGSPASPCFSVGIEENNPLQITIQPNPAKDFITINITENNFPNQTTLSIYNVHGQKMLNTVLQPGSNTHTMDISHLASGIYLLDCSTPEGVVWMGKMVKH